MRRKKWKNTAGQSKGQEKINMKSIDLKLPRRDPVAAATPADRKK